MEIQSMIALRSRVDRDPIPVLRTVAVDGAGVSELRETVSAFIEAGRKSGEFEARRHRVQRWRLLQLAQRKIVRSLTIGGDGQAILEDLTRRVVAKEIAPCDAVAKLVGAVPQKG
jgi:putative protein kinase ArgK-like GTPase of G3E family